MKICILVCGVFMSVVVGNCNAVVIKVNDYVGGYAGLRFDSLTMMDKYSELENDLRDTFYDRVSVLNLNLFTTHNYVYRRLHSAQQSRVNGVNAWPFTVQTRRQMLSTSAEPVSAAIWSFASGLLGLVGVSRRRND